MQLKNNLFLLVVFMVIGCEKKLNNQEDSRVDTLPFFNEASFTPKWISPKYLILY
jgi:protein SCO1/2